MIPPLDMSNTLIILACFLYIYCIHRSICGRVIWKAKPNRFKMFGVISINMQGNIISGEFDEGMNEFYLQNVKSFTAESVLKKNQLTRLFYYLKEHENENDGQILTLYDQMPVRLSQHEVKELLEDLEKVLNMYH
jgi:hypothetical protein